MESRKPVREMDERVFARLGCMTVKAGQVQGNRITSMKGGSVRIEYLVGWLCMDDRKEAMEWFAEHDVLDSPNDAFGFTENPDKGSSRE